MTAAAFVLAPVAAYCALLFAVAALAERTRRRSPPAWLYVLSLGVYCTSWTYYGSVGRASARGIDFLPIYLGPTLAFMLGWPVLARSPAHQQGPPDHLDRRLHRQPLRQVGPARRAGHADRGGRLGALHRAAAQGGVGKPAGHAAARRRPRHRGARWPSALRCCWRPSACCSAPPRSTPTSTIAAWSRRSRSNSVVKLACLAAVGLFAGLVLFDGFPDLFARAAGLPQAAGLIRLRIPPAEWTGLLLVSMAAAICLPRQFQMLVVENRDERHLARGDVGLSALSVRHQPVRAADRARRAAAAARRQRPATWWC